METYCSELFPAIPIYLGLFINIRNALELKEKLKSLDCSFLNPKLIISLDHIRLAVTRALHSQSNSLSKTNSLYLDMIYYLSSSSNIRQSLQKYGIQDTSESIVLVSADLNSYNEVIKLIQGDSIPIDHLSQYSDIDYISKEFKITPNEIKMSNGRVSGVLSRIAIKDL